LKEHVKNERAAIAEMKDTMKESKSDHKDDLEAAVAFLKKNPN
jgi:hypothetical protein